MAKATKTPIRFKLPARIRNMRAAPDDFAARMALVDRIADLPGIETIERSDETVPCQIDIFLKREVSNLSPDRNVARKLCSLDCNGVTVSGLDRWARYQALTNHWGKLIDDQVCVHLPRDQKELEVVWSIIRRAYDRFFDLSTPKPGSMVVSTWDWPRFSRTSLQ